MVSLKKNQRNFELDSHSIHLWSAFFPNLEQNLTVFEGVLSKEELKRANDYKFSKDRKRFIIARGVLRYLLSKYLDTLPQELEFAYGVYGKPQLNQERPSLKFNLSHSYDYALYAITKKHEVGIDIEYVDPHFEVNGIAKTIFSPEMLPTWKNLPLYEKTQAFFKQWTYAEAFLKAHGMGWLASNEIITQLVHKNSTQFNISSDQTTSHYSHLDDCIPNYMSTLCILGPKLKPIYRHWNEGPSPSENQSCYLISLNYSLKRLLHTNVFTTTEVHCHEK